MTIKSVGVRHGAEPIRAINRTGHSTEKPDGNRDPSPQKQPRSQTIDTASAIALHKAARFYVDDKNSRQTILEGEIDEGQTRHASKVAAIYQSYEELNHRQHIESVLGIDEYA